VKSVSPLFPDPVHPCLRKGSHSAPNPANLRLLSDVTRILQSIDSGESRDGGTAEELLALVYEELRHLAAAKMANERPGQTLQATALVHEAWLRLDGEGHPWKNRKHFFGAAAEAMRRILIERARKKRRPKHGGDYQRIQLEAIDIASDDQPEITEFVHDALERLAAKDAIAAELIKLRFFAGIPNHQAAELLGLSERSARRNWAYARAWLAEEIERRQRE
jgi:RNA polymerase sigma factor (TIGR02999 family)